MSYQQFDDEYGASGDGEPGQPIGHDTAADEGAGPLVYGPGGDGDGDGGGDGEGTAAISNALDDLPGGAWPDEQPGGEEPEIGGLPDLRH